MKTSKTTASVALISILFGMLLLGTWYVAFGAPGQSPPNGNPPSSVSYFTLSGTNLYPTSTSYNVGIGATAPGARLQVSAPAGSSTIWARFRGGNDGADIYNSGDNGAFTIQSIGDFGASQWVNSMALNPAGGNVGIGTTGPGAKLHVGNVNGVDGIRFSFNDTQYLNSISNAWDGAIAANNIMQFRVSNANVSTQATVMTLTGAGNVGIGATSPGAKLDLGTSVQNNLLYLYNGGATAQYGFGIAANTLRMFTASAGNIISFGKFDGTTYTDQMVLNAGNVGIGATTPKAPLQIGTMTTLTNGVTSGSGSIFGFNVYNSSGTYKAITTGNRTGYFEFNNNNILLKYSSGTQTADTALSTMMDVLTVDTAGNVGIGTSTPTTKLYVQTAGTGASITASTANSAIRIKDTDSQAAPKWGISWARSDADYTIAAIEPQVFGGWATDLKFFTNTDGATQITEKMRITSGGNVGIGTASPATTLDVNGSLNAGGFNTKKLFSGTWDTSKKLQISGASLWTANSSFKLIFKETASCGASFYEEWTVQYGAYPKSWGNELIIRNRKLGGGNCGNVINPSIAFEGSWPYAVSVSIANAITDLEIDYQGYGGGNITTSLVTGTVTGQNDQILSEDFVNGRVGIGTATTSPSEKLTVDGNVLANAYLYSSDQSLKKDIVPISGALDKIRALTGVSFNWKDTGRPSIGFLAQDVEKVFPELVKTSETTGLKSVEYGNLTAALVQAVKEQQAQIEGLKSEVEALKK